MTGNGILAPGCAIGFVGLGRMGRPMASRLAAAGYTLQLVDADPGAARETAAQAGGRAMPSVAELGPGLAAVILMLPDGHAVRGVLVDDGLLQRLEPGCVVIDMGSCEPEGTVQLGALAAARGLEMIDAPVSGGVARARTGELTIMAGGRPEALERCRPLLETMGNKFFATGALGSGQAMKSLNNFVSAAGLIATCEAVIIGQRFGLDATVIAEVLNGSTGKNNTTEHKLRQFILSRSFASGFALDLMVKDLAIAASVARQTHTPTVLAERCLDLWRQAQASLGRGCDHTEMARWLETAMRADGADQGDNDAT
jgi:3-hydroxyisobutyrate dehydrogenase